MIELVPSVADEAGLGWGCVNVSAGDGGTGEALAALTGRSTPMAPMKVEPRKWRLRNSPGIIVSCLVWRAVGSRHAETGPSDR
jgi:hypothetical protein